MCRLQNKCPVGSYCPDGTASGASSDVRCPRKTTSLVGASELLECVIETVSQGKFVSRKCWGVLKTAADIHCHRYCDTPFGVSLFSSKIKIRLHPLRRLPQRLLCTTYSIVTTYSEHASNSTDSSCADGSNLVLWAVGGGLWVHNALDAKESIHIVGGCLCVPCVHRWTFATRLKSAQATLPWIPHTTVALPTLSWMDLEKNLILTAPPQRTQLGKCRCSLE